MKDLGLKAITSLYLPLSEDCFFAEEGFRFVAWEEYFEYELTELLFEAVLTFEETLDLKTFILKYMVLNVKNTFVNIVDNN